MDYTTAINTGAQAFNNRWDKVKGLMDQIMKADDPKELQKLQMLMQVEMQKFEAVKKMLDDVLSMLKKTKEEPRAQ